MLDMGITYQRTKPRHGSRRLFATSVTVRTVTVSYRGEPVAEIRPIRERPATIEERTRGAGAARRLGPNRRAEEAVQRGRPRAWRVEEVPRRARRVSAAYVDTSALVAVALQGRGGADVAKRLGEFAHLVSSNLLEAELRATFAREKRRFDPGFVSDIEWVLPDRSLVPELAAALEAGYLRGADLWHVATALYVAPKPSEISFVTLDGPAGDRRRRPRLPRVYHDQHTLLRR